MRSFIPVALLAALTVGVVPVPVRAQSAPATATPAPRHPVHHRPRHRHAHRPSPPQPAPAPQPDQSGLQPAPVPNPDIGPPEKDLPPNKASLDPGNLQLHYPPVGDGFLPNSNAEHFDNEKAPMVPGLSVTVPLTQTPPSNQPPP